MKVLVTGSEGYIGSLLAPMLIELGHDVVGLDIGFYRNGWLYNSHNKAPACITKDQRDITVEDLEGFDAVVHLAELSNDPIGQLNTDITYTINHQGSFRLARLCKEAGITRFVYSSSCSIYGVGTNDIKSEDSEIFPQTAYADCKRLVERDVSALADDNFSPTFLRNATAYGASPRMRFDLVVNNLSGLAWTTKEIKMTSDGTPWRPLVHLLDICQAMACTLAAPREAVHNEIFNVGDNGENYQVRDIAQIVSNVFVGCELSLGSSDGDNRSYRVSFDKINTQLPGFKCRFNVESGVVQLRNLFEQIDMYAETFEYRGYTRLKQLEHLISTKQIDGNFYYRDPLVISQTAVV